MTLASSHRCSKCPDDWSHRSLAELIDHIVHEHHAYLRRELPKLNQLAEQCAADPSPQQVASLLELRRILTALTQEMTLHMHKEEFVLFPWIWELESAGSERITRSQSLAAPIGMLEHEHHFALEGIARLHWLTCRSNTVGSHSADYRLMLAGLAELEADLHQHIHEENDVLFRRAMELDSVALLQT
jgi:regulator of cell morphogenesis and NO signaling